MQVLVELVAFSAGGAIALVTSRLLLGGVLGLTFRPSRRAAESVRKAGA
jgi:hypothetical protein